MLSDDIGNKRQLIQLVFMLFEFLSKEEKLKVYEDFSKVNMVLLQHDL
jgi:hypothetical protein